MWSIGCIIYVLLSQYEAFSFDTSNSGRVKPKWAHIILEGLLQNSLRYPSLNEVIHAGFAGKEAEQIYRRHSGRAPKTWTQHLDDLGALKRATNIIGSPAQVNSLLNGLICFDPKKRMTATQVLNLSIFDNQRRWINRVRSEHPPAPVDERFTGMTHPVESEHIRAVMTKCISSCLESEYRVNGLYRASAFFLGLSLMDRYIDTYREELGVKELTKSDSVFLACICLNIGHKYYSRDDITCHSREAVFPPRFMTADYQRTALAIEQSIVTKFSLGNMAQLSEYDAIDRLEPKTPSSLVAIYERCFC